jgi:molecular chaperone GrpE
VARQNPSKLRAIVSTIGIENTQDRLPMLDRQALFDQLLDYLQSSPDVLDYLGPEPNPAETFDPYQMVAEWIALRQEMKQQGKLLQTTQDRLQKELESVRSQNEHLQQQLEALQQDAATQLAAELANQEKRFGKQQEELLKSLLNILDSLDRACEYWQEQAAPPATESQTKPLFNQLTSWLLGQQPTGDQAGLADILASDRQGIELIQRNLQDLLAQHTVTPMAAQGQPFDPKRMYALGRKPSEAPENTVIQEVVRGYMRGDRILREAQVIVSASPPQPIVQQTNNPKS